MEEREEGLEEQTTTNEAGKITVDDAIEMIVGSNKELKAYWVNTIDEEYEGSYDENRQDLIDIITVVDYIIEKYKCDDTANLPEIFANIEAALQDPTPETQELVVTGILEGLQNSCNMEQLDYHTGFNGWLGEKSKGYWDALIYVHESNDPADVKEDRIKTFL